MIALYCHSLTFCLTFPVFTLNVSEETEQPILSEILQSRFQLQNTNCKVTSFKRNELHQLKIEYVICVLLQERMVTDWWSCAFPGHVATLPCHLRKQIWKDMS